MLAADSDFTAPLQFEILYVFLSLRKSGMYDAIRLEFPVYMLLSNRQRHRFVCGMLAAAQCLAQAVLCGEPARATADDLRICSDGQTSLGSSELAIIGLVRSLAEPLKKAKARNVIVLDIKTPGGRPHPVGKWLADELSAAIRTEYPKISTIDRSKLSSGSDISGTETDAKSIFLSEIHQAQSAGADLAIIGDFAAVSNQIGISLRVINLAGPLKTLYTTTGLIPISKEIADLSTEAIPTLELKDGIPRGGMGGMGMPVCAHCPSPQGIGRSGVVTLEIVVTNDGRPDRITVMASPDPDLSAIAVRTVRGWRFKPALGFDGNPIAVFLPIQVTFNHR
jgi:TonB family protein